MVYYDEKDLELNAFVRFIVNILGRCLEILVDIFYKIRGNG